jgi:hypothetical protein
MKLYEQWTRCSMYLLCGMFSSFVEIWEFVRIFLNNVHRRNNIANVLWRSYKYIFKLIQKDKVLKVRKYVIHIFSMPYRRLVIALWIKRWQATKQRSMWITACLRKYRKQRAGDIRMDVFIGMSFAQSILDICNIFKKRVSVHNHFQFILINPQ